MLFFKACRLVKDVALDEQTSVVPWTIANKYYTAEVKFLVYTLPSWTPVRDELLAPALLFVWNRGEPYRDQIRELSQHTSQHDFEVALAIRLPSPGSTSPAEIEDDQDIDVYLSSEGFEFVDIPDVDAPSPDRTGIPGIPRIIDALSTIMWPSMVRQSSKRATTSGVISAVQSNTVISPDEYHNLARLVGERISGNDGDRMRRELEELECWLDQDTLSDDAAPRSAEGADEAVLWSTVVTPGTLSPSSSGFFEGSRPTTPKPGFDDDFTSFVSASPTRPACAPDASSESQSFPPRFPPLNSASFSSTFSFDSASSGRSTPILDDHASFDTTRLAPGESYKTLGSVSDFGDPDKESVNLERSSNSSDKEDEDMPSRAEIADTSRKIFGAMPLSQSPVPERGDEALGGEPDIDMPDADLERFDLQRVLGALQGLKEEIGGMPDKERRKAAARVALGLAYGLADDPDSEAS
ncbi:hypothetical protein JVU11DRAFT_3457 [Chiua virens]|nr:hypothetical protein JVU11DRAFT_3457 [Chiua virens]